MRTQLEVIDGEKGRDPRATLRELHDRYGGQVFGRCRYLLGDRAEAEDATQEVFARAFCSGDKLKREASALSWLLQIATNHCLNVLRANKALWKDEVRKLALVAPTSTGGAEQLALVRSLLARFDPETQACAVHYLVDEMSQDEVAIAVGISVPTVRKRVRAFLATARAELGLAPEPGAGEDEVTP